MADNFMFHNISEKEKEKIKEQSKAIMNSFSKKLEVVDELKLSESMIERDFFERDDGSVNCCDIDREIMFENAPSKKGDSILGEKKSWE